MSWLDAELEVELVVNWLVVRVVEGAFAPFV
jgi:hypothetical protein